MNETQCTLAKPKAPLTAFMLFCNDERPKLVSASGDDKDSVDINESLDKKKRKLLLGDLQKLLSEAWKTLGETERQVYVDRAQLLKDEYNKNMEKWMSSVDSVSKRILDDQNLAFPSFRLQKLMKADKNAHKVSSGALNVINKATVMFLQTLIKLSNDCRSKRKVGRSVLIKDDIVTAIRRGGIQFKFLESCNYIIEDVNIDDNIHFDQDDKMDEEDVKKIDETSDNATNCVELDGASVGIKNKKKHPKLRTSEQKQSFDIRSFFKCT